jgi:histidyl-tRNA synthetase
LREYLVLASILRGQGIAAEVYLEPAALRDQIGYASSKGIPLAVIAGESEFTAGNVAVRDLRTRSQEIVTREQLAPYVAGKVPTRTRD